MLILLWQVPIELIWKVLENLTELRGTCLISFEGNLPEITFIVMQRNLFIAMGTCRTSTIFGIITLVI